MEASQNVAMRGSTAVEGKTQESNAAVEKRRDEQERVTVPAVDIFEDPHRITIKVDMPGVSKDHLSVHSDRNGLVIEGTMSIKTPENMQALYADLQASKYRRSFVLSRELDSERIDATLKDGVLTVRIPKRTEFQARKIKVNVG